MSWLQPRKNNCVPTELDVSILALDPFQIWIGCGDEKEQLTYLKKVCKQFDFHPIFDRVFLTNKGGYKHNNEVA